MSFRQRGAIGREAVLVVDTGQFPSIAARVIADRRKTTSAPVRYVVNTHWNGDHLLGNDTFRREAFRQFFVMAAIQQAWPKAAPAK